MNRDTTLTPYDSSPGMLSAERVGRVHIAACSAGISCKEVSIMSSRSLYRLSGGTLIVGSLLILLSSVVGAILFPGHNSTPQQVSGSLWPLVTMMILLGSLLFVIALPGMYMRQAGRAAVTYASHCLTHWKSRLATMASVCRRGIWQVWGCSRCVSVRRNWMVRA
jgi:hypothetical protein